MLLTQYSFQQPSFRHGLKITISPVSCANGILFTAKTRLLLTVLLLFLLACFYSYFYLYFNLVQLRSVILYTPNCITIWRRPVLPALRVGTRLVYRRP